MTGTVTESVERRPVRLRAAAYTTATAWQRPLPAQLHQLVPAAVRREHEKLVARAVEATDRVAELDRALDRALTEEEAAARAAILAEQPPPPVTSTAIEEELVAARRQAAVLAEALPESATRLLQASLAKIELADERARARAWQHVPAAITAINTAITELEQVGPQLGESMWLRTLLEKGWASPFTGGGGAPRGIETALAQLRQLVLMLQGEVERQGAHPPPPAGWRTVDGTPL